MKGKVRIIDSGHIGIWEDAVDDKMLRRVFAPLGSFLSLRGWSVERDPLVEQNYPTLSDSRRFASKGKLALALGCSGRHISLDFWLLGSDRYHFNPAKLACLDRLALKRETQAIVAWLCCQFGYVIDDERVAHLGPMQRAQRHILTSGHYDAALGHAKIHHPNNALDRLRLPIKHGQTAWAIDYSGRIIQGVALYNLNNMWWFVTADHLHNFPSSSIFSVRPANLRKKHNERQRRSRLEAKLSEAAAALDFMAAIRFVRLLFGDQQLFRIFDKKKGLYFGPLYSGYTSNIIAAGLYTQAELKPYASEEKAGGLEFRKVAA